MTRNNEVDPEFRGLLRKIGWPVVVLVNSMVIVSLVFDRSSERQQLLKQIYPIQTDAALRATDQARSTITPTPIIIDLRSFTPGSPVEARPPQFPLSAATLQP